MNSISDKAGSSLNAIQKKMNYNGDVVFFETGADYQDEDIRAKLASQLDQDTYEVLKLLHVVSARSAASRGSGK